MNAQTLSAPTQSILRVAVTVFLLLASELHVQAQTVMVGGKIAGQVTGTFTKNFSTYAVKEDRVEFGPMAEFKLPRRLSLEVEALHKRRLNYSSTFAGGDRNGVFRVVINDNTASSWEIPVLVKWHRTKEPTHPFVGVGFSLRHIGGSSHIYGSEAGIPFDVHAAPTDLVRPWTVGMIAALGMDVHRGFFHLQPELRYTRWPNVAFASTGLNKAESNLNRLQVLIGIAVGK